MVASLDLPPQPFLFLAADPEEQKRMVADAFRNKFGQRKWSSSKRRRSLMRGEGCA